MSDDIWGSTSTPAADDLGAPSRRLAGLLDRFAASDRFSDDEIYDLFGAEASEFAEVRLRLDLGWHVITDDPMWWLVPAAWPSEHRLWLPDTRPRFMIATGAGNLPDKIVANDSTEDEMAALHAEDAAAAGLPAPPRNRVWLIRSPSDDLTAADILHRAEADAGSDDPDAVDIYRALRRWFGSHGELRR